MISILFIICVSFLFAFIGSVLLWKNMSFFSDGIMHSIILISIINYLVTINPFFSVAIVMLIYFVLIKILGKFNNTNLIIGSQIITVFSVYIKKSINLKDILLNSNNNIQNAIYNVNMLHFYILLILSIIILFNINTFIKNIILSDIKIHTPSSIKNFSIGSIVTILLTLFIPNVLFLGASNIILCFLLPQMCAYEFSRNNKQMLFITFIITLIFITLSMFIAYANLLLISLLILIKLKNFIFKQKYSKI